MTSTSATLSGRRQRISRAWSVSTAVGVRLIDTAVPILCVLGAVLALLIRYWRYY